MRTSIARHARNIFGFLALFCTLSLFPNNNDNLFINGALAQDHFPQAIGLTREHPLIQKAMGIQNKYTKKLMKMQGVLGTGIGLDSAGQPVIKIYAMRTGLTGIPTILDGIPVKVEVTGMIVAQTDPMTRQDRPVPIGVSTGHPDITAGTIGARVRDPDGNVYALSNNHVYANSNDANIGDNILQPGAYDGGTESSDVIGNLSDFELIIFGGADNVMDAAIAISSIFDLDNATPGDDGYGAPSPTTLQVGAGQIVKKYGRTTGLTFGTVEAINTTVEVCYEQSCTFFWCRCTKSANFINQFSVTDNDSDDDTTFSAGGDSGSLIVTKDGNQPVGLLFAGGGGVTFASPIDPVLNRFNVVIDGGSEISNYPPSADFTYNVDSQDGLEVAFTDESTDSDGSIMDWSWNFGDGNTSATQNPTHVYAAGGTYSVSLTVTDNEGLTDTISQDVEVTASNASCDFELTANPYRVFWWRRVELTWATCAISESADIYRDGSLIAQGTENDGNYVDSISGFGSGRYSYQICENNTSNCSDVVVASF